MAEFDQTVSPAVVIGRLLQVLVYAPIGAGVKLVEDAPAVLGKARQELDNARFIGKLVVTQGEARVRDCLAESRHEVVEGAASEPVAPAPTVDETAAPVVTNDAELADEPTAADLALPDYDHLPAIDILGQLESLSSDELAEISAYERANRRRRTVLGKIEQLSGAS